MTRPTGWKSYDSVADEYERLVPPLFQLIARDLVELLRPRVGAAILDVGTGTGVAAEAAGAVGAPSVVVGVDPSLPMLRLARRRVPRLVGGVAPGLPFPDQTFDAVVANLVLSHFPDAARSVADLVRVLRPGGRLGATAWPEDQDEPESDAVEAGGLVELALDHAGLANEAPTKAAAGEEWLKDPANLRGVLTGAGLDGVVFEVRSYRRVLTPADYLGGRLWGGRGRYLRTVTDDATWDGFRSAALAALDRRFPDGVRSITRARLAIGRKPS